MRGLFIVFLFVFSTCFSQSKKDSITRVQLTHEIDSLEQKLKTLKAKRSALPNPEVLLKEWTVNGRLAFIFNQASFSNWTAGGENNVAGNISVNYDFNYRNDKLKWDNKIIAVYGSSHVSGQGYRKTDDRFEYNSVFALNNTKNWYFSFFMNFISQFSRGFDYSKTPKEEVSSVLSPAYLSFGPGILWRKNENMKVNIAPATSRFTFVSKPFSGKYGVPLGRTSTYGLGFSMSAFLKYKVMKNVSMENIVAIYSDYLMNPENIDINYQMNFLVTINKYLTTNLTLHGIADDNASSRIQLREVFGLGVNYTFHKI